ARLHNTGAVRAGSIGADMILRETRGAVQVQNVGGDLRTSHLHGDCQTTVGGDLKAGAVSGNLNCTVGGDAVLRVEPQSGQAYRIHAGGDIRCRLNPEAGVAINAHAGGGIRVDQLPIQTTGQAQSLQATLGDGSAALDLTAGGDILLASQDRQVEWSFEFNEDVAEEWGGKAAAFAERIAQQVEHQFAHFARHLDDRISHFANNEEISINVQEKVQSAMQRAEEKISEAMRRAEERAREAEARAAERQARHEERARRHEEQRQHHVRPQHMHHPRPITPVAPPVPPSAPQAPAVSSEERMMILKMLSEGQITVEQADQLLAALGGKVTE
ncbi:MAG: hypothetical protein KDE31_08050, partial [Caldilineaceae bacterium]|nr:hypothetical protein [Caldilineaceae bacterium]